MLTLFAIPKAFVGHIGVIQRNAIQSWIRLHPRVEVILFADERGTAEVAQALGVRHVPELARNEYGTPLLNGVFETAQRLGTYSILGYVNADIVLMSDFIAALRHLPAEPFLLVGRRWEVDIAQPIDFGVPGWEAELRRRVISAGRLHGPEAMDYFVFRRGQVPELPPFAVGRAAWDNWMVYRTLLAGAIVIDATASITAVHQNHDYAHVVGGIGDTNYYGPEADTNRALAKGMVYSFDAHYANRVLTDHGLARPPLTGWRLSRQLDLWALHSSRCAYVARAYRIIVNPRDWPFMIAWLGRHSIQYLRQLRLRATARKLKAVLTLDRDATWTAATHNLCDEVIIRVRTLFKRKW